MNSGTLNGRRIPNDVKVIVAEQLWKLHALFAEITGAIALKTIGVSNRSYAITLATKFRLLAMAFRRTAIIFATDERGKKRNKPCVAINLLLLQSLPNRGIRIVNSKDETKTVWPECCEIKSDSFASRMFKVVRITTCEGNENRITGIYIF